ncbi:MAG: hypothetical protein LUQ11_04935, partial [Methylococcaceae bacterium]|nr:hypothetical protein [Methylococcaceae bacterium]
PLTANRAVGVEGFSSLYAAPSTGGFERISPLGAMQGCIALSAGAGMPLQTTPFKAFGAQDSSGIGAAFSLVTFFWRSKRKSLAFGCENPIQIIRRDSDTKKISELLKNS